MRHAIEYIGGTTHYATRKVQAARHGRECRKGMVVSCGGAFKCMRCGKLVGWCKGESDGTVADNWCDDCAERVKP